MSTAFGCYQLSVGTTVDALVAIDLVPAAEAALHARNPGEASRLAAAAARVLDQPFLPAEDGVWFEDRRRELAVAAVRARLVESAAATATGEHQRAIEAAEAALRHDRYQEDTYRRLMAAHAAAGNRAEADRCTPSSTPNAADTAASWALRTSLEVSGSPARTAATPIYVSWARFERAS